MLAAESLIYMRKLHSKFIFSYDSKTLGKIPFGAVVEEVKSLK